MCPCQLKITVQEYLKKSFKRTSIREGLKDRSKIISEE
jgi:hypothetical protein